MRDCLRRFILNCNPALPHGVARSRISAMKRPCIAQQNSRFDHASRLLERCHGILATPAIDREARHRRSAVVRFKHCTSAILAKIAQPTLDEPCGMGIKNAQLLGDWKICGEKRRKRAARLRQLSCFLRRFPEHGVYQRSRRTLPCPLDEPNGFVDRGMCRYALEKPELVDAQA